MNHIKQFFKEKGLYLFCLAMVFAATAAGILALRSIVGNVADLTRLRKEALQDDTTWTQPDTAIDKPAQDVPKPTTAPTTAPTAEPRTTTPPAESTASAQTAAAPGIWDAKPLAAFSGDELVYSATLGDWRTHNGADYAAPAGESVYPAKAGKVDSVTEDALWGYVVEITDKNGVTWRYCGLTDTEVKAGDSVTSATAIGKAGSVPAEANGEAHQRWCVPRPGGAAVMADGKSRSPQPETQTGVYPHRAHACSYANFTGTASHSAFSSRSARPAP